MATQPPPAQPPQAKPAPPRNPQTAQPAAARPAPQQGPGKAVPVPSGGPPAEFEESAGGSGRFIVFNAVPSWFISMMVHILMFVLLAVLPAPEEQGQKSTEIVMEELPEAEEEIEEIEPPKITPIVAVDVEPNAVVTPTPALVEATNDVVEDVKISTDIDAAAVHVELSDFGEQTAPRNDLLAEFGSFTGSGVEGRGAAARGKMVRKYGGTADSEAAVARALAWLAAHQMQDGGWHFNHSRAPTCGGRCDHDGSRGTDRNAATALALLPFLGAGQTHKEGDYQKVVFGGLKFLLASQDRKDGSLNQNGSMYSHGIAAIALCEAYAMTHDQELMVPAQAALNFIVYAQDPVGGGWRYNPRQAGDTSVVGWQLMALKSGHMAYLTVPPNTIKGTIKFLDGVQEDSGAAYGYTGPGRGSATTSVGLLCRMYTGWGQEHPGLERGVQSIAKQKPSMGAKPNMYYNYYATQVMRHYYSEDGAEEWDNWNEPLRDWLVKEQSKTGHTTGSWYLDDHHGATGGRLYITAMATMILEVYYRHMPIYAQAAAKEEFPL